MVKSQNKFNEKYSNKETIKEIKIKTKDFKEEQLDIEGYLNLEKLYLYDIQEIEKVTLENLPQLQECTIWDCGTEELTIKNCPQIKKLNIRQNNLTNLEFLKDLDNLENLEIDGNTKIISGLECLPGNWGNFFYKNAKLIEVLKLYGNDWKSFNKDTREIFELSTKQDFQGLIKKFWDLKKSREDLKEKVSSISEKKQQPTTSRVINTKELVSELGNKFKKKDAKINYLESRAQELIDLSKQQKEKIVNAYLTHFGSEKELAKNLIEKYLEFIKFKKQETNSLDYDEKCEEYDDKFKVIKKQLRTRLDKEAMNGVQRILTDCEKLVEQELELETKLDDKSSLIKEQKQNRILQTIDESEEKTKIKEQETTHQNQVQRFKIKRSNSMFLEIELAYNKGKLEAYQEKSTIPTHQINILGGNNSGINIAAGDNTNLSNTHQIQYNIQYQQLETETEKQITESLTDKEANLEEQKIINKTILFLGTKELFINHRQATINNLIDCYNKLEKRLGNKLKRFTNAVSMTNIAGKLANIIPGGGVVETPIGLAGDVINLTGTIIQGRDLDKFTKQFQEILVKDKKNLSLFDGNYLSLINVIWKDNKNSQGEIVSTIIEVLDLKKTEQSTFSNDHNAFSQSVSGTWQGRTSLDLGEMKSSIEAVINNFNELKQKIQVQKEQLSKQEWFKTIETKTDLLQEKTISQTQIPPK